VNHEGPNDGSGTVGAIELGGCEGCSLGCAVACGDDREDRALEARQVLLGSGLAVVLLSVGPALVARHTLVFGLGMVGALLGLSVAILAGLAVRVGRPAGDRPARLAFRLLPVGIAGMLLTGLGAVLARLL
jgi:hypothetical protein